MATMPSTLHRMPSHPAPVWVGRFGARLMGALPSVGLIRAVHSAVGAWPHAAHLEPEVAADILLRRMGRTATAPQR